jgi:hypothetical protein
LTDLSDRPLAAAVKYNGLAVTLIRLIRSDPNVKVVTSALGCLAALAEKLGKQVSCQGDPTGRILLRDCFLWVVFLNDMWGLHKLNGLLFPQ